VIVRGLPESMYAGTYGVISCDEPEIPAVAYPSQGPPCSDLRRVLNNLQFWCTRGDREAGRERPILLRTVVAAQTQDPEKHRGRATTTCIALGDMRRVCHMWMGV